MPPIAEDRPALEDKPENHKSVRNQVRDVPEELREYLASLPEGTETGEFLHFLQEKYPRQTSWLQAINRREFLKLLAAPLALAGLTACVPQPVEKIMPYIQPPEQLVPGVPMFYATAMELGGYARGVIAESQMGRPIKIEGNPHHPASLGATDVYAQASILGLYDPDRAQVITNQGIIRTWEAFYDEFSAALLAQTGNQGVGLRILTGTVTSPTLASQLAAILNQYPRAKWHQYDPVNRDNLQQASEMVFGEPLETRYLFDRAQVILSLDADFVLGEPGNLRYIHDFSTLRQVREGQTDINRLYVVESSLTNTGALADHRLALQARQIEIITRVIATKLGIEVGLLPDIPTHLQSWVEALVSDLQDHKGSSLVLAGPGQPPQVHALVININQALGNIGQTVLFSDPILANPTIQTDSLFDLAQDLNAGDVDILVCLDGNPVFTAPVDLNFPDLYPKARLRIYHGLYLDETASLSNWHIPATHYLEMWGDTRAYDGTASIIQPLIQPLYNGYSPYEILAAIQGQANADGYDLVRQYWQSHIDTGDFEGSWRGWLQKGVIPGTAAEPRNVSPQAVRSDAFSSPTTLASPDEITRDLEIVFAPDPSVWDGRFANNAWLQELPKPISKLTWDNAALISPTTAARLQVSTGELVELAYREQVITFPVWVQPGLPDGSVTIYLGYGRQRGGNVLQDAGFNAYLLRTSRAPWFDNGLEIRKTGRMYSLATTQGHHNMEGRDLVKVADIEVFRSNPDLFKEDEPHQAAPPSLYPEYPYDGYAWGMSINLNTCVGCNACVVACQAENNIPVVGKDQVLNMREMHWLRIDSYYQGDSQDPKIYFQPVPCMHCEKAPCESVCPVNATVHSSEGLNEMVYNRCIGTRYCSNNCPYKVRRFNFLQFSENLLPLNLGRNPDVTVRERGVMEKCTYCVQRISSARIRAEKEGRPIQDGDVRTACQQACPANAIIFGDINDPSSQVYQMKQQPQDYALLAELGTQPRTTYLAKFRNPNPMKEDGA